MKLSLETVKRLAGEKDFERGRTYWTRSSVTNLRRTSDTVTADVEGREVYHVVLKGTADDDLTTSCTCPRHVAGYFCKHAVAVSLAVLHDDPEVASESSEDAVKAWLGTMDRESLAGEFMALVRKNIMAWRSVLFRIEFSARKPLTRERLQSVLIAALSPPSAADARMAGELGGLAGEILRSVQAIRTRENEQMLAEAVRSAGEVLWHAHEEMHDPFRIVASAAVDFEEFADKILGQKYPVE